MIDTKNNRTEEQVRTGDVREVFLHERHLFDQLGDRFRAKVVPVVGPAQAVLLHPRLQRALLFGGEQRSRID